MENLKQFSIPIRGLGEGSHRFDFQVDQFFFQHFEQSEIEQGQFNIQIDIYKQAEMFDMNFRIEGKCASSCDRCLADIQLPVQAEYHLVVKRGEDLKPDPEVLYVDLDSSELNLAGTIYEYIHLSLPIQKIYECEEEDPRPCDDDVLDKLEQETNEDNTSSSIWDELKNIK